MTRFTRPAVAELSIALGLALQIGPVEGDGLTDEDPAVGWSFFGEELMGHPRLVGTVPGGGGCSSKGRTRPNGTPGWSVWPSLAN
jgi:hypothetical protein